MSRRPLFLQVQWFWRVILILLVLRVFSPNQVLPAAGAAQGRKKEAATDLYRILGVKRTATAKQIKKAYRKRALQSHPDKRKDIPPEQAAEEFHRVVKAFEVLSDTNARQLYDRTGRTTTTTGNNNRQGGGSGSGRRPPGGFHFHSQFHTGDKKRRKPNAGSRTPLYEKFEAKEAMSRVLHVKSLRQLRDIMLKDEEVTTTNTTEVVQEEEEVVVLANESMKITKSVLKTKTTTTTITIEHETVERHLLMAFCTPGEVEDMVDKTVVFPYPFAALSQQGIWWEEFLQTVKVRFSKSNKLTRFFDIPHPNQMGTPIFIFVRKGEPLTKYEKLITARRDKFTRWMWNQLQVTIRFFNRHGHDVDIWWVHDEQVLFQSTLKAQNTAHILAKVSHTFWFRDARVNKHLTEEQTRKLKKNQLVSENSTLQIVKLVSDEKDQHIKIEIKACMDLSTTCSSWRNARNCTKVDHYSSQYTNQYCRKTCGVCTVADDYMAKKEQDRCKDDEPSWCRIWARKGECKKNEPYMRLNCRLSCRFCDPKEDDDPTTDSTNSEAKEKKKGKKRKNRKKKNFQRDDEEEDFVDWDTSEEWDIEDFEDYDSGFDLDLDDLEDWDIDIDEDFDDLDGDFDFDFDYEEFDSDEGDDEEFNFFDSDDQGHDEL